MIAEYSRTGVFIRHIRDRKDAILDKGYVYLTTCQRSFICVGKMIKHGEDYAYECRTVNGREYVPFMEMI